MLTSTFLEMIENKHVVNFAVAVYARNTHSSKDLGEKDSNVLHRAKRIIKSPVVFEKQLESLIQTISALTNGLDK